MRPADSKPANEIPASTSAVNYSQARWDDIQIVMSAVEMGLEETGIFELPYVVRIEANRHSSNDGFLIVLYWSNIVMHG